MKYLKSSNGTIENRCVIYAGAGKRVKVGEKNRGGKNGFCEVPLFLCLMQYTSEGNVNSSKDYGKHAPKPHRLLHLPMDALMSSQGFTVGVLQELVQN